MTCCKNTRRMNDRVQVQKPNDSATPDAAGHIDWSADANWITVGTFNCSIKTRGGAENWRFRQLDGTVNRIFELRSSAKTRLIDARYRLRTRKDDGTWRVHGIAAAYDVDSEGRIVQVHATEVV